MERSQSLVNRGIVIPISLSMGVSGLAPKSSETAHTHTSLDSSTGQQTVLSGYGSATLTPAGSIIYLSHNVESQGSENDLDSRVLKEAFRCVSELPQASLKHPRFLGGNCLVYSLIITYKNYLVVLLVICSSTEVVVLLGVVLYVLDPK